MMHWLRRAARVLLLTMISSSAYSVDEVKAQEKELSYSAIDQRFNIESYLDTEPFVLIPHKPNYFIGSFEKHIGDESKNNLQYDGFESKFQLSFKVPVTDYDEPVRCFWLSETRCLIFFGYTQLSVWQMFNFNQSSPFRDTSFQPELFMTQLLDMDVVGDWKLRLMTYGLLDHQSNGNSSADSRSWNRTYVNSVFENGKQFVSIKLWARWNERSKTGPTDFAGDDNPGIEDYVGNSEFRYFYADDFNNYTLVLRDSKNNPNGVNYELGWSYPLNRKTRFRESELRLYVQYFNGYGETLIDYNKRRQRIGIGVMLTDWL